MSVVQDNLVFKKMSTEEDTINLKKEEYGVVWFLFLLKTKKNANKMLLDDA